METQKASPFAAIRFSSWDDLYGFSRKLENWFYRGQADAGWKLTTSLERAIGVDHGSSWDWDHTEKWMLRQFKGFAHNYMTHLPDKDDNLTWLSIMQHHGAPTRLLDCTHAFPVAAFFAARDAHDDFAVWAFDWSSFFIAVTARFNLQIDPQFKALEFHTEMHRMANDFLTAKAHGSLALPILPMRSDERMEAQQGMFFFPCDPARTFLENVGDLIGANDIDSIYDDAHLADYAPGLHNAGFLRDIWLLKLVLPKAERFNALRALRDMNVHDATLFPGLDGFARSLGAKFTARDRR